MKPYAHYTDSTRFILPMLDSAIIVGAFRLADYLLPPAWIFADKALFLAAFTLLWCILSQQYANIFRLDRLIFYSEKLFYLLRTFLMHALLLLGVALLLGVRWMPLLHLTVVYDMAIVGVVLGRFLLAFGYRAYQRCFAAPHSRFVIVGASASGQELYHFLQAHDQTGTRFKGFFADEPVPAALRHLVRGPVAAVQGFCQRTPIDEIYFALPLTQRELMEELSGFATENFLSLRIVPDYPGTLGQAVSVYHYAHLPVLVLSGRRAPLALAARGLPRAADYRPALAPRGAGRKERLVRG